MQKLTSSITSTTFKLIDIYNKIITGALITAPHYQRKLVWKKQHKYAFIETILLNFPFPEVYIASQEVDTVTLQAKEAVVDGQQRLTTIVDYIKGTGDFLGQKSVKPFDDLTVLEKKEFLNYNVSVKDLKDIGEDNIKEVFKRINSTNYSLNSNEVLNAEYGGGEFAIFAKALVDEDEDLSQFKTDINIADEDRKKFIAFFKKNEIFNDHDVKRMFDAQFIMLISSTILEGNYFGRNSKIEQYLEKYNDSFDTNSLVISTLRNAIDLLNVINLSPGSYWLNKPNLLTLLFELREIPKEELNLESFELKLLELEQKMDLYFSADEETDISHITEEERKYFEVARQGSHELASRQHRGKLINKLIVESKITDNPIIVSPSITEIDEDYAVIIPTETGLKKSIMDATSNVRDFLKTVGVHDYEAQEWGPEHKKILDGKFMGDGDLTDTKISIYRSKGRGDYRIWFSGLSNFASSGDHLTISFNNGQLKIENVSKNN
ncbi:MAG: DUF262 domain-containing protein [Chryseobacterium sp.]|nr:MAG: DUF262 domain-containing protein [Chryseobacterium sp.]